MSTEVEQDVQISLYTYNDLQYLSKCYETFYESEVYVTTSSHDYIDVANPGSAHLSMITMEPDYEDCWGTWCSTEENWVLVEVYTNFGDGDLLPHDW